MDLAHLTGYAILVMSALLCVGSLGAGYYEVKAGRRDSIKPYYFAIFASLAIVVVVGVRILFLG
jgi:hypothetical protein